MRTQLSIGFGTCAFLILFVLKIIGQTDMNWFFVLTSWIWVPIAALLAGLIVMFCFGALVVGLAVIFGK